jgi:hypothetical protein
MKKGDVLMDHPGINNLIKKSCRLISTRNATVTRIHIYIIALNFTNCNHEISFKYLILYLSWMARKENEIVKESYHTLIVV